MWPKWLCWACLIGPIYSTALVPPSSMFPRTTNFPKSSMFFLLCGLLSVIPVCLRFLWSFIFPFRHALRGNSTTFQSCLSCALWFVVNVSAFSCVPCDSWREHFLERWPILPHPLHNIPSFLYSISFLCSPINIAFWRGTSMGTWKQIRAYLLLKVAEVHTSIFNSLPTLFPTFSRIFLS